LLFANSAKKGYYIRCVKEALWSTFGKTRIQLFTDDFTKEKIKAWKKQLDVRQVYDDLYKPIDPNNPGSDTYLALIIHSVFAEKECLMLNATWTQAVLESIFDMEHLSMKIDNEILEKWMERLSKNDSSSNVTLLFIVLFILRLFYLFYASFSM